MSFFPSFMTTPMSVQAIIDKAGSVREGYYLVLRQEMILLRSRLSEAQNHRCCWCARRMSDVAGRKDSATLEHIIPRSLGGSKTDPDNCAVACERCNRKRGVQDIETFQAHVDKMGWADPRMV